MSAPSAGEPSTLTIPYGTSPRIAPPSCCTKSSSSPSSSRSIAMNGRQSNSQPIGPDSTSIIPSPVRSIPRMFEAVSACGHPPTSLFFVATIRRVDVPLPSKSGSPPPSASPPSSCTLQTGNPRPMSTCLPLGRRRGRHDRRRDARSGPDGLPRGVDAFAHLGELRPIRPDRVHGCLPVDRSIERDRRAAGRPRRVLVIGAALREEEHVASRDRLDDDPPARVRVRVRGHLRVDDPGSVWRPRRRQLVAIRRARELLQFVRTRGIERDHEEVADVLFVSGVERFEGDRGSVGGPGWISDPERLRPDDERRIASVGVHRPEATGAEEISRERET